jgi:hypothetical protein
MNLENEIVSVSNSANNRVLKAGDTMTGLLNVANNLLVTGSVGIGTTNPLSKLHISGEDGIYINRTNGNPFVFFGVNEDFSNTAAIYGSTDGLIFYAGTSTPERVRINADGNVGIGTTSPIGKLNLYIDVDTNISIGEHPSYDAYNAIWSPNNDYVLLWQNSGHTFLNSRGSGNIYFREDNNDLCIITNNGNMTLTGTLTENSSETIKENINPIKNALDLVSQLSGVTYDRKDGSVKKRAGLIAEEVDKVLPNVVQKDSDGNPSGIQYTNLIAYLIESIKELKTEISILKSK